MKNHQAILGFQTVIIVECCACRKVLGYKDGLGVEGVSHGYCKECEADLKNQILMKLEAIKNARNFI